MSDGTIPAVAVEFTARPVSQSFGQLTLALLVGGILAAALGAQNLLTRVEDLPPSPLTDAAIGLAQDWQGLTERAGLAAIYPSLRRAERWLEGEK